MRIYKVSVIYVMFFQIVFCSDTIKFNTPDSLYITNSLDSIIQDGQSLNTEYYLQVAASAFDDASA